MSINLSAVERDFSKLVAGRGGKPAGDGYLIECPAHRDTNPSLLLTLKDDGRLLLCCRANCSTDSVLAAFDWDASDLFDWAPGDSSVSVLASKRVEPLGPGEIVPLLLYVERSAARLYGDDAWPARDYIERRFRLSDEQIRQFKIGFDSGAVADPFPFTGPTWTGTPRLVVPFFRFGGNVIHGAQGRALRDSEPVRWVGLTNPEGKAWGRYGVFELDTPTVVITEGPADALTAVGLGYSTVAIPGAARAASDGLADELAEHLADRRVVVVGDDDEAGRRFARELVARLAASGIEVAEVVPEAGDLNEWAVADQDAVRAAIDGARPAEVLPPLRNDDDMADVVMAHLGGQVLVVHGMGFRLWNGKVWEEPTKGRMTREVRAARKALEAKAVAAIVEAKPGGDKRAVSEAEAYLAEVRSYGQATKSRGALAQLEGVAHGVTVDDLDGQAHLLTVRNGIVDLRTGDLLPHDPAMMLTKLVDVDYRPDAVCPRWDQFLGEVFPHDPDLPEYVQTLIGYGITGSVDEQFCVIMHGTGSNGKSALVRALNHVFGDITKSVNFGEFEKWSSDRGYHIATIRGARLVFANEGEQAAKMSEPVLKRLTGKDRIVARQIRQEPIEFDPTFLLFLATNHMPNFQGQDEGLWRRIRLIDFPAHFSEANDNRDLDLDGKLAAEAEGILAWAVKGAVRWYARGMRTPESVLVGTRRLRDDSDELAGYLGEILVVTDSDTDEVLLKKAYEAYLSWADANGLTEKERLNSRAFRSLLRIRGVERTRHDRNGTMLVGVCLDESASVEHNPGERLAPVLRRVG